MLFFLFRFVQLNRWGRRRILLYLSVHHGQRELCQSTGVQLASSASESAATISGKGKRKRERRRKRQAKLPAECIALYCHGSCHLCFVVIVVVVIVVVVVVFFFSSAFSSSSPSSLSSFFTTLSSVSGWSSPWLLWWNFAVLSALCSPTLPLSICISFLLSLLLILLPLSSFINVRWCLFLSGPSPCVPCSNHPWFHHRSLVPSCWTRPGKVLCPGQAMFSLMRAVFVWYSFFLFLLSLSRLLLLSPILSLSLSPLFLSRHLFQSASLLILLLVNLTHCSSLFPGMYAALCNRCSMPDCWQKIAVQSVHNMRMARFSFTTHCPLP